MGFGADGQLKKNCMCANLGRFDVDFTTVFNLIQKGGKSINGPNPSNP